MIVSHRHRLVFIKTLKTAGTSIEVYLSPRVGDDAVVTPIWPAEPGHEPRNHEGFYNHMSASEARDALGEDRWADYFSFAVERNPWDKLVSHYAMERHRHRGQLDWDTYFAHQEMLSFRSIYCAPDGNGVLVDRVIRYEQLDEGLGEIFAARDIEWSGSLGVRAKSGFRDTNRHYRDYYSDAQRQRVAEACAWEIETFGYEF